jgi:hypothetical protein
MAADPAINGTMHVHAKAIMGVDMEAEAALPSSQACPMIGEAT